MPTLPHHFGSLIAIAEHLESKAEAMAQKIRRGGDTSATARMTGAMFELRVIADLLRHSEIGGTP